MALACCSTRGSSICIAVVQDPVPNFTYRFHRSPLQKEDSGHYPRTFAGLQTAADRSCVLTQASSCLIFARRNGADPYLGKFCQTSVTSPPVVGRPLEPRSRSETYEQSHQQKLSSRSCIASPGNSFTYKSSLFARYCLQVHQIKVHRSALSSCNLCLICVTPSL